MARALRLRMLGRHDLASPQLSGDGPRWPIVICDQIGTPQLGPGDVVPGASEEPGPDGLRSVKHPGPAVRSASAGPGPPPGQPGCWTRRRTRSRPFGFWGCGGDAPALFAPSAQGFRPVTRRSGLSGGGLDPAGVDWSGSRSYLARGRPDEPNRWSTAGRVTPRAPAIASHVTPTARARPTDSTTARSTSPSTRLSSRRTTSAAPGVS